jgi:hypothetical protein
MAQMVELACLPSPEFKAQYYQKRKRKVEWMKRQNRFFRAVKKTLYGSLTADMCHDAFVQTYRMPNTKSESSCEL